MHKVTPGVVLVVGAILVDDLSKPTRLLAARRTSPVTLAGRWEFPGGKVEPGERPEDALAREIHEELRVRIILGDEIGHADGAWPLDTRLVMRVWLATAQAGAPTLSGSHDELRWLNPGTWHSVNWLDGDRPILQELEDQNRFRPTV